MTLESFIKVIKNKIYVDIINWQMSEIDGNKYILYNQFWGLFKQYGGVEYK